MERRGTKVEARQKYMCPNERETVGKVKMQGDEVIKVEDDDAWFIDSGIS